MPTSRYEPIFELTRGRIVETIHFGAIAVVDSHGKLLYAYGDPQTTTFLRSSAKPFQALPFFEHKGHEHFRLTPKEIALICSSHSGTDEHVSTVRVIQAKTGVQEGDLMCGTHIPFDPVTQEALRQRNETPTPNRHNCSGKHTGMLAYTIMKHLSPRPGEGLAYIDPSHPVQQEILHAFAEMCDLPVEQVEPGTDGCSAPNFAVPLYNAAYGYAHLIDPDGLSDSRAEACRTITAAMTANPTMVGGPDSFDTALMEAGEGRFLCKGGAEGYQSIAIQPGVLGAGCPGIGIAMKVSDGDLGAHSRAAGSPYGHVRPAVALEILRQLDVISAPALEELVEFGPSFTLYNWRKLEVGEARPCFTLRTGQ